MLRSEVVWFPRFLLLCRVKKLHVPKECPYFDLLDRILTCRSYREVHAHLEGYHWLTVQAVYALRTQARLATLYDDFC